MQKKTIKTQNQNKSLWQNARLHIETKKKADAILKKANQKKSGRRIKLDQLISLSLGKINDSDIIMLQNQSLTAHDHFENMRSFYIKQKGQITSKDFTSFTMSLEYIDFLNLTINKSKTLKFNKIEINRKKGNVYEQFSKYGNSNHL